MSEKHESEDKPREWVCSNGTIVTDHIDGALAGRLHLESTAGETVLVPAAELLQFLSDHLDERDALKRRVEELEAQHEKVTSIGVVHALRDALESLDAEWKTSDDVPALVLRVRDAAREVSRQSAGDWDRDDSHLPKEQR